MRDAVYGLLGRSLKHSFSPEIHRALGVPDYRLIALSPEELDGFFQRTPIGGLNVTMPYKKTVLRYCTALSDRARAIGSVNTLLPLPDGGLFGDNTDAPGFSAMARRAGIAFAGRKVLIFGSGGGSLAARFVAEAEGARQVVTVSRGGPVGYESLSSHADAEILINATPLGMYPDADVSPADLDGFPRCTGVLDLVYNPLQTAFLRQAEEKGVPHSGGLFMLVAQAAAAAEQFLGWPIPEEEVEALFQTLRAEKTNLVLIGMPGCGKTAVGRALAALTGREAVDLDEAIAEAAGMSVPAIFAERGEAAFREMERELTARYGAAGGRILITGGGAVKSPENFGALRQNGRVYHLRRPLAALSRAGRPLSEHADLGAMEAERLPLYERFRHAAADNDGTPEAAAAQIWADFCGHFALRRN